MKRFIDKILDVPKLIRTIWLMLWIILIILLVLKFCFNQWYPIVIENQWFKNLCDFIDNNKWCYNVLLYLLYIFNFYIGYLICRGLKRFPNWYISVGAILLGLGISLIKQYNNAIGLIIEIIFVVLLPITLNIIKKRFTNNITNILIPIIYYVLLNVWQLTIFLIRGLDLNILSSYPFLIYIILQLDYYIFTIITWIGVSFMGFGGLGWLWTRDVTILKAERDKELAKTKPDMGKVFEINARIEKLEKESK